MADASYNLGINVSVGSVGVNSTLNAIEQRFQKFSKTVQTSSQSMNTSMKGSLATIDQEMNKFDQLNNKMQQVSTGKEDVSKQSQKMEQTSKKERKAVDDLGKTTDKHTKSLKDNTSTTENWLSSHTRSIGIAVRSTAVWGVATTAIYGTQRALREAHETMVEVNSEMVALQRVMNESITNFDTLRNTASDLGVDLAANVQDVVSAMVEWGRQGRNQVEVIELTEAALLATNVAQMDSSQAVDLLTSSLLQFNMEASESIEIIDRWNEVANNYAITATDIAMSLRESGAAAQSAGISMDELIGMTTALSAATAKTGNRIGRSLRTVFSRMMGDMGATSESVGKVEVALNSVGVALRESETEYRNMTDVITDLAVEWDDLDQVMQANIARAIGGRRRYSDVIALIENWDMALDATQTSMGSVNSAIEENEKYMQSVEASWQQVNATFNQIINTLTEGGFDDWSIALAQNLRSLLEGVNNLIRGFQELKNFFVAGGIVAGGLAVGSMLRTIYLNSTQAYSAIATLSGATTFQSLLGAINPVYAAVIGLTAGITTLTKRYGELQNRLDDASSAKENFAEITKEVNVLSKTEIENSKELINQYSSLSDETSNLLDNMNPLRSGDWGSYFQNIAKSMIPLMENDLDKAMDNIEVLATTFPELFEQFGDSKEFLLAVQEELKTLNSNLESSVKWIIDDTDAMYENTQQGIRNAKMLEEKSKRYFELADTSDKTTKQEQEMLSIQQELRMEYYELASAETDFATALKDLTENEMSKFGDEGTEINKTVSEMEESLKSLNREEENVEDSLKRAGDRVDTLSKQYNNLKDSEDATAKEINDAFNALEQARDNYTSLGETLEETREKQVEYINSIESLEEGMDGLDPSQFLSNFEGAIGILEDFNDEADSIITSMEDLDMQMQNELDFENWLGGVLDRSPSEQIETEIEVLDSYMGEAQDLYKELFMLDPEQFETKNEIRDYIEENFEEELSDLDLTMDDIYDAWDDEALLEAQNLGRDMATNMVTALTERIEAKEDDLSSIEMFKEALDVEDLASASIEELEKLTDIFDEYISGDNTGEFLSQMFPEDFPTFSKLVENAERVLQLREEEADRRSDISENIKLMDEQFELEKVIKDNLNSMVEGELSEYETQLQEVQENLKTLTEYENDMVSPQLRDRISQVKNELEEEKEVLEAIIELQSGDELGILEEFQNFDISDITSMDEAISEIERLEIGLINVRERMEELGMNKDEMTEALSILGLDEETIDKVFKDLEERIEGLEDDWYKSMAEAINNALEQFTDDMSFGNKLGIIIREGLISAFDNLPEDEIRTKFEDVGSWLSDNLNLGETFSESFADFSINAGEVYAQGGSIGQSLVSGIGSVLSGNPLIGQTIGNIGQAIFGGVEGRDEMEKAKEINSALKDTQDSLEGFGITYDATLATFKDDAGFMQGLFGGEDWDVDNLDKAEADLENMEEIMERVQNTASSMFSNIENLISDGLSGVDFEKEFKQTIGQDLQNAIIDKLLETQAIENQIKTIAGMAERAIGEQGQINWEIIDEMKPMIDEAMEDAKDLSEYTKDIMDYLDLDMDVEQDVTSDRTYRAGSTSSITYHNTFSVQSQVFTGDKASAREAAKLLAPFIKEYLDRNS